jgi:imidazolonepropionase-like amidohydrolase
MDRGLSEALRSGVTCAVVSPGSANPIAGQICALKTAGRWVDRMIVAEPLAIKFAMGENPKMTYGSKNQTPYTRMAVAAIIREQLHKARRYLLARHVAESDPAENEPEYDARCEALIPLLRRTISAHFHAHKAYDILTAIRIAEEFDLNYTIIHGTEGHMIADILAEKQASVVCGPLISARTKPELAGLSAQNCAALANAGVTVAICTDHPEIPSDFLASSAALATRNGLSEQQALDAITIDAAKAAGLEQRLGSITPGKDADLLVFSENPLGLYTKPDAVYIEGRMVAGEL